MQTTIVKLTNYQPRLNLPSKTSSRRGESNFLFSFFRAYYELLKLRGTKRKFLFTREIEINGYGIADLMLFEYSTLIKLLPDERRRGYITTFEIKIKDWRKALKQAIRYKYYSNRAIVVIPEENIKNAKLKLELFRDLNVGLWSFEKKNKKLIKLLTPKFHKPLNYDAKEKALFLLCGKFKFL